jgi:hypothetical protein
MPASSPGVPLQPLALRDGRHGSSDWLLGGLYVLGGCHVRGIWG